MEAETKSPLHDRPWKIIGRFDEFEKADKVRKECLEKEDLQAKVKKLKDKYVVKTRSTVVEKKKEKKKEKKRNKGRRRDRSFYMLEGIKAVKNDS